MEKAFSEAIEKAVNTAVNKAFPVAVNNAFVTSVNQAVKEKVEEIARVIEKKHSRISERAQVEANLKVAKTLVDERLRLILYAPESSQNDWLRTKNHTDSATVKLLEAQLLEMDKEQEEENGEAEEEQV